MTEPRYIPANESPRFAGWFEGWCRRNMIGKKFHALRVEREAAALLRSVADGPGPLIIASNHVAWWDPLVMLTVQRVFFPERSMRAPMDAAQLERFRIFKRLGIFGIDPDDPASLARMGAEMGRYFRETTRPTFWITPQGTFADVRAPIVVRPGVSKLAASTPGARVLAVAVEYPFWTDPKPEILVTARAVETPDQPDRTTAWQRAITAAMEANAARLAGLAVARNERDFEPVVSKEGRQGGFFYSLWLRLRGKGGGIAAHRAPRDASEPHPAAESSSNAKEGRA
ncbi:MAG: lysophospholipid acyltransferase family protein [Phycisphaerales bacterium]|nr:lysophospholipid acyltransferase family protein [Planctomycetota bacterium]MCH8509480.1 lysophospholipid acyltransferase family protein [Phycisphaerales bacterium]